MWRGVFLLLIPQLGWAAEKHLGQTARLQQISLTKPPSTTIPNFSGDGQYAVVGDSLSKPIRVQANDENGQPVSNIPVRFSLISSPKGAGGFSISKDLAYTDENGLAAVRVNLGSKAGEYVLAAKLDIQSGGENNLLLYKASARKGNWVFMLIIGLLGGLGMFLYGMKMMSDGMKKTAGDRMKTILSKLTHNRFVALGVGAFVTMIIQSSSATTVMLVSFVQAQLMTFVQSLGVIMGANIGTTITAQLVAFKLTDYALLMVALGMGVHFLAKQEKAKNIGETILGFGLLFFGMRIMSEAMYPLRSWQPFIDLLITLENPVLGILVGAAFTALIQSSSAFTGILIVLAIQGLLTLEAGVPLILGANIGTCITAGLASLGAGREAKRVAAAHTLFQVAGVLVFIFWIPTFAEFIRSISPQGDPGLSGTEQLAAIVPRQIANAHTIFNIATALIVLPFARQSANLILKILPDREETIEEKYKTRFIDDALISTPVLALSLAKAEILVIAEKAKTMAEKILNAFVSRDAAVLEEINNIEQEVDFLYDKTNLYLTRISQQSISEEQTEEAFQMMYAVTEFEQIADIVHKNLAPRARKWLALQDQFSEKGRQELIDFHQQTIKQVGRALTVFKDVDLQKAKKMKRKFKKHRSLEEAFVRTHFERLRDDVPESQLTSETHQDLLEQFRRMSNHATNIARIMLQWRAGGAQDDDSPTPALQESS